MFCIARSLVGHTNHLDGTVVYSFQPIKIVNLRSHHRRTPSMSCLYACIPVTTSSQNATATPCMQTPNIACSLKIIGTVPSCSPARAHTAFDRAGPPSSCFASLSVAPARVCHHRSTAPPLHPTTSATHLGLYTATRSRLCLSPQLPKREPLLSPLIAVPSHWARPSPITLSSCTLSPPLRCSQPSLPSPPPCVQLRNESSG